MQYLYSGKIQIQTPSAKCRDNRSSEQQRHERQLFKFAPFKVPGFPLIAGDLGGSEQLFHDSIGIQISRLSELSFPELPRAPRTRIEQAQ